MIEYFLKTVKSRKIIFAGFILGITFWILESFLHSLFFEKRPFIYEFLFPGNNELWMRMLILFTLAVFTWSVRYLIVRLKRKQKALKENEASYRTMAENLPGLVYRVLCAKNNRMIFFNDMIETMTGYTADELTAGELSSIEPLILPDDQPHMISTVRKAIEHKMTFEVEYRIRHKNGDVRYFLERGKPIFDPDGELRSIDGVILDITERKHAENRQALSRLLLETINRDTESDDQIPKMLKLVQEFTGFEAVGIRLKDGDDFPYYTTSGFTGEFVEAERYLCTKDQKGELIRNSAGNPVLECMCGNVICGRTNPFSPFFTKGGSFWTNSTSELLASTSEEDRQSRTRNRCNSKGYESVALIPLRSKDETIGLLQLNDSRKNMFTEDMIEFFEGIGASVGIGFEREKAREEIRSQNELFNNTLESLTHPFYVIDANDYTILMANTAAGANNIPAGAKCYQLAYNRNNPCDNPYEKCPLSLVKNTKKPVTVEHAHFDGAGRKRFTEIHGYPVLDRKGNVSQVIKYTFDITERKLTEEALEKSEKLYRETLNHLPLHVAVTDRDGTYLIWNEQSEKIFGYSSNEVIGKMNRNDIICRGNRISNLYDEVLGQGIADMKVELVNKDGKSFPAHIVIVPLFRSEHEFSGYIELVEDLTSLEKNKKRINNLSRELMNSEENQRQKLRSELHDEAGVAITATKFDCQMIKELLKRGRTNEIEPYLESIIESSNKLSSELRKLFYNLSPANINEAGLVFAVTDYISKVKIHADLDVGIDICADIEKNDIVIKTALYRVVQEAITNIIRHANASNVSLSLKRKQGKVSLVISDDGNGFDVKTAKENVYGLKGINQRINDLGGKFHINSTPGHGTSLKVDLPSF